MQVAHCLCCTDWQAAGQASIRLPQWTVGRGAIPAVHACCRMGTALRQAAAECVQGPRMGSAPRCIPLDCSTCSLPACRSDAMTTTVTALTDAMTVSYSGVLAPGLDGWRLVWTNGGCRAGTMVMQNNGEVVAVAGTGPAPSATQDALSVPDAPGDGSPSAEGRWHAAARWGLGLWGAERMHQGVGLHGVGQRAPAAHMGEAGGLAAGPAAAECRAAWRRPLPLPGQLHAVPVAAAAAQQLGRVMCRPVILHARMRRPVHQALPCCGPLAGGCRHPQPLHPAAAGALQCPTPSPVAGARPAQQCAPCRAVPAAQHSAIAPSISGPSLSANLPGRPQAVAHAGPPDVAKAGDAQILGGRAGRGPGHSSRTGLNRGSRAAFAAPAQQLRRARAEHPGDR